jgi:hypothetical protein
MELILYPRLSTRSKRAITRRKKKWGHPYHYSPRGDLLERLSSETGMSIDEVYFQLQRERQYLLSLLNT